VIHDGQVGHTPPGVTIWYAADVTYIPTDEGWLYLAGVKDLATREIIGHAMSSRMTKELTHTALERAIRYRKPRPGCIHHSDRGSSTARCPTKKQS